MNILSFKSMYLRWAKAFEVNGSFYNPSSGPEQSSYLGRYVRAGFSASLSPLLSVPKPFVVDSCLLDSLLPQRSTIPQNFGITITS